MDTNHDPANITPAPLLTAKEVMAFLRIGRTTLYQLTKCGDLPYFKVGGELRFQQSDINDYLKRVRSQGV